MKLNAEYNLYLEHKKGWLKKRKGLFVLIKGKEIAGFYNSSNEAYQIWLKLFGNVSMLIHQILKKEPVIYIGRTKIDCLRMGTGDADRITASF